MNDTLREVRDLLERAKADLEKGWPEAAYDCIGRALRAIEMADRGCASHVNESTRL